MMICGAHPPDACGIGHYFFHLIAELVPSHSLTVFLPRIPDQGNRIPGIDYRPYSFKIVTFIRRHQTEIVHWQLISQGFRYSISFLGLMLYLRIRFPRLIQLVTLHDFSSLHPINRIRLLCAAGIAQGVIVTVDKEKAGLKPFQANLLTIPIASNISLNRPWQPPERYSPLRMVLWGFPTRTRNIAAILEALQRLIAVTMDFKITLIPGWINIPPDLIALYQNRIRDYGLDSYVSTTGYLSESDMIDVLLNSHLSLLIFTDGVSFRRTSFIGSAGLGIPMIVSDGPSTDPMLRRHLACSMLPEQTPSAIVNKIIDFIRSPEPFIHESRWMSNYIRRHHTWKTISRLHSTLYRKLCPEPMN
ncbi:MAG: glycosyltransferase [Candidatus Delongbacteria bacterium]|nr:glycosyltransferase [Candidatus Delongbacteria bacterium]